MTGYTRDDVLTPEDVRDALRLSASQWERKRHIFPWSRALGERTLRIRWGAVLDVLESTTRLSA